ACAVSRTYLLSFPTRRSSDLASVRAPAAEATVVQADEFAGEVRSVAELLSIAPGVSLHSLGGPGQATTLSLRGATADESLVLLRSEEHTSELQSLAYLVCRLL